MLRWMLRRLHPREVESPVPLPEDVTLRRGRVIPWLGGLFSGMRGPAAAVTLGRTIVIHPRVRPSARLVRHELAHVEQWRGRTFRFPSRYVWWHLRYGYGANPLEQEARAAEEWDSGRAREA